MRSSKEGTAKEQANRGWHGRWDQCEVGQPPDQRWQELQQLAAKLHQQLQEPKCQP